jgi:filamentous hemagglutinin family protein
MKLPSVLAEQLTGQQRASSASLWRWRKAPFRIAIAFSISYALIASSGDQTLAQIVPDTTLGGENSRVTPITPTVDQINGGATRGVNLFHSFQEFNVGDGRAVYFINPAGIENILTRVTGTNASNILGTLGVAGGNANLFLINPSGIIFGLNARLDVGGSFVATTANAVGFGTQGFFSASAPNVPPLLTVNPSAFLFNQIAAQPIINQSLGGLQVKEGQSLLLLGGEVKLDGGVLVAPGGRVELGGVAGIGTVELNVNSNNLRLSFPDNVARADVSLTNGAGVGVLAGGGGSIAINTRDLNMDGGSRLQAGITSQRGAVGSNAGDIDVNASRAINLTNGSIVNGVLENASGNGGSVNITTGTLSVTNRFQVVAITLGQGDAGNVNIFARDTVSFDRDSAVFSSVEATGVGNAGNINITTGSLALTRGAQLIAVTRGRGDAGSVNIHARDTVSIDGVGSKGFSSAAASTVETEGAVGNGGTINISTGSLVLTNGAQLLTSTRGRGNAGSVNIFAHNTVFFDGVSSNGYLSQAASSVESTAIGNGGDINITTGSLALTRGAQLQALTRGRGNAGNVNIFARDTVSFDGMSSNGYSSSALSSVETKDAVGNGGTINITTGSLAVTNGAQLQAYTSGRGNAGSININARDTVSFDGVSSSYGYSSAAFSSVDSTGVGNGSDINITTGSLVVKNGAFLSASTYGQGDGGKITINANTVTALNGGQAITTTYGFGKAGEIIINVADSVTLSGSDATYFARLAKFGNGVVVNEGSASGVFSNTSETSTGRGGELTINTGQLIVRDGAQVTASSQGSGEAGKLEITAGSIELDNKGKLTTETRSRNGGNITLQVQDLLLLRHGSLISTTAGDNQNGGNGGNITITTPFIVAVPKENSDISANAFTGNGGKVEIKATGIFGTQFREKPTPESDITASSTGGGINGIVSINTPDIDPSRGLANLPENLVDTSALIANSCIARSSQQDSSFTITGRGGLPPRPGDAFTSPYPTGTVRSLPSTSASNHASGSDLEVTNPERSQPRRVTEPIEGVRQSSQAQNLSDAASSHTSTPPTPAPLVEAYGWMYGAKGEVILTAQSPTVTPHSSWSTLPTCPK